MQNSDVIDYDNSNNNIIIIIIIIMTTVIVCYVLTFFWPSISVYLSYVFNQLGAEDLFYSKLYFMPLHVSSTCARNM